VKNFGILIILLICFWGCDPFEVKIEKNKKSKITGKYEISTSYGFDWADTTKIENGVLIYTSKKTGILRIIPLHNVYSIWKRINEKTH